MDNHGWIQCTQCSTHSWYRTIGKAGDMGWTELEYGDKEDLGVCWRHNSVGQASELE